MSGYLIAQLNMTDKESFKLYAETVPESVKKFGGKYLVCLLYTSPSPRDATLSRMPSSA